MRPWIYLVFLLGALWAFSEPLKEYRRQVGAANNVVTREAEAIARVKALREKLGTVSYRFDALEKKDPDLALIDEKSDNGFKATSAGLFKTALMKEADGLQQMEKEQPPPGFDPDKTMIQAARDLSARRRNYCNAKMGKEFPHIVSDLVYHISLIRARPARAVTPKEQRRIQTIQAYLRAQAPPGEKTIDEILGYLYGVDFVDGSVIKLRFTKLKDVTVLQDDEKLELSLSMLLSYRADKDDYYLAFLECIEGYVVNRLEKESPGYDEKAALQTVRPFLASLRKGGNYANNLLHTLSPAQVNFLLDLMLQLRGADIPVDTEMEGTNLATWNPKTEPSVVTYVEYLDKKYEHEEKYAKWRELLLDDLNFYVLLDDQLTQLANYLDSEKGQRKEAQKAVDLAKPVVKP